jgi:opacity protein-like surface antigen
MTDTVRSRGILAAGLLVGCLFSATSQARDPTEFALPDSSLPAPTPPPISAHYLQYGVALTGETIVSAGRVCPNELQCILGDGGGLLLRIGYRSRGPWYLGGAYEFSRQDSANLLRLAILQQLRAELRVHLTRVTRLSPYLGASLGGAIYGNEWGLDTWGGVSGVGAGLTFQVTPTIVLNVALNYRQLFLHRWIDDEDGKSPPGPLDFALAHVVALEFGFEIREPLSRW